jgi:hypothetical protein
MAATVTLVGMATVVLAPPAAGGGPPGLYGIDSAFVPPGRRVTLRQERVQKLDRTWKGPYQVSLVWASYQPANAARPATPPAPVHVGDLRVERWSDELVRVEVSFVVPRLPQGNYDVVTCNPGCRDSVGELGASSMFVGTEIPQWAPAMPPPMPVTPDDDAPVTTGATTVPTAQVERVVAAGGLDRSTAATEPTASAWLFLAGTAAALAVVVLGSSVHRSRRRTRAGRDAGERGRDVREA